MVQISDYFENCRAAGGDIRCVFNTNNSEIFFFVVVVIHRRDEEPIYSYRLIADVDSCNKSIPAEIVCLTSEREHSSLSNIRSSRRILMVFSQSLYTHTLLAVYIHTIDVRVRVCVCRQQRIVYTREFSKKLQGGRRLLSFSGGGWEIERMKCLWCVYV